MIRRFTSSYSSVISCSIKRSYRRSYNKTPHLFSQFSTSTTESSSPEISLALTMIPTTNELINDSIHHFFLFLSDLSLDWAITLNMLWQRASHPISIPNIDYREAQPWQSVNPNNNPDNNPSFSQIVQFLSKTNHPFVSKSPPLSTIEHITSRANQLM